MTKVFLGILTTAALGAMFLVTLLIGLPHDRLREVLRKYNRLVNPAS